MKHNKYFLFLAIIVVLLGYYFYFIKTLMLSQIIGKTGDAKSTIFINLFDFDTDLTRYDLYNLSSKREYWNSRMNQVNSIQNLSLRNAEQEKLIAEMMEDPSLKKITRKILGFGGKASYSILQAVLSFTVF
jgi:hypothetical protein